jgi:hypothetical protein
MKGFQPLGPLRRSLQVRLQEVLGQRFFHDRLSMSMLVLGLAVCALSIVNLAFRLRPSEAQVPIHFTSFTLFDQLGPWYYPLEVAFAALGIAVVNAVFAYKTFTRSRLASFFLLVTGLVVGIFAFIIVQAFGEVPLR